VRFFLTAWPNVTSNFCTFFVSAPTHDANSSVRASFLLLTHGQPKFTRHDGRVPTRFGRDVWLEPEPSRGIHRNCCKSNCGKFTNVIHFSVTFGCRKADFLSPSFRTDAQYLDEPSPKRGPHEVEFSLPSTPSNDSRLALGGFPNCPQSSPRVTPPHLIYIGVPPVNSLRMGPRSHFMLAVLAGGDSNSANAERGLVDPCGASGFSSVACGPIKPYSPLQGDQAGTQNTVWLLLATAGI
jgi:hypothetical protein